MSTQPEPQIPDAARAVGALLAPVVACLRGDDDGVRLLLDDTCEAGAARVQDAVRAAPAVARIYLQLAPPPDGALGIVREVPLARAVFVDDAMTHGDLPALESAVASCWWCALRSARLRDVDPIAEAAAICRYVARVA